MTGAAWEGALPWVAGTLGVIVALAIFRKPIQGLLRLAGRTGVGLMFLAVFSPIGQFLGAGRGVNLFNALVLGVLGAPGFGLLLMLKWVLQ